MPTLLKREGRELLRRRVTALRPDTPARWGRFTAPQMLAHAIQSVGMMTGDLPVKRKRVPWVIRRAPLKQLLIYVLPFPKGLPTSPELLARDALSVTVSAEEWADELRVFERALERIPQVADRGVWPVHPAFGPLSGRQWGALQYRHLDHHFRQFGL